MIRRRMMADWIEKTLSLKRYGSQHSMMLVICTSRLLPFVSLDLVSYAAGLTPLTMGRFMIATMVGILPASFLLAHMGSEISSFDPTRIAIALILLLLLGLEPLAFRLLRKSEGD